MAQQNTKANAAVIEQVAARHEQTGSTLMSLVSRSAGTVEGLLGTKNSALGVATNQAWDDLVTFAQRNQQELQQLATGMRETARENIAQDEAGAQGIPQGTN